MKCRHRKFIAENFQFFRVQKPALQGTDYKHNIHPHYTYVCICIKCQKNVSEMRKI